MLASLIDHTYLKADATETIIRQLCQEAATYQTASVAVNNAWVSYCVDQLKHSPVKVCAVIAFPLGQTTLEAKLFEAKEALELGADEVDYVLDIGRVHMQDYDYIRKEMKALTELVHQYHKVIKVIFETCYLSDEQIIQVCQIASEIQPDFVKTSTGFGSAGATVHHVQLMKQYSNCQVKASGGIRDQETALAMVEAGASRLGVSATKAILGY